MKEQNDSAKLKVLYDSAKAFYENDIPIHLSCSKQVGKIKRRYWYNGKIKKITSDFIILDEHKLGELPVFFLEIWDLEKLKEKNNGQ